MLCTQSNMLCILFMCMQIRVAHTYMHTCKYTYGSIWCNHVYTLTYTQQQSDLYVHLNRYVYIYNRLLLGRSKCVYIIALCGDAGIYIYMHFCMCHAYLHTQNMLCIIMRCDVYLPWMWICVAHTCMRTYKYLHVCVILISIHKLKQNIVYIHNIHTYIYISYTTLDTKHSTNIQKYTT